MFLSYNLAIVVSNLLITQLYINPLFLNLHPKLIYFFLILKCFLSELNYLLLDPFLFLYLGLIYFGGPSVLNYVSELISLCCSSNLELRLSYWVISLRMVHFETTYICWSNWIVATPYARFWFSEWLFTHI